VWLQTKLSIRCRKKHRSADKSSRENSRVISGDRIHKINAFAKMLLTEKYFRAMVICDP